MDTILDPSALELITGGDPLAAAEIKDLFKTDTMDLLATMGQALASGDDELLRRLGHTLKSTAATVGAMQASSWGKAIEDGGLEAGKRLIPLLEEHLQEVFRMLDQAVVNPGR